MSNKENLMVGGNGEENLMDIFKESGYLEAYPNTKVKFIKDNVYAVFSNEKNIALFADKRGETIINIGYVAKQHYFKKASILAGYIEIKQKDGVYDFYEVTNVDKETNKIELGKEIDKYSEEYFDVWMDIAFYSLSMSILLFHKEATDGGYTPQSKEGLKIDIKFKALKIKDLHEYLQRGQITQELYKELLPQVQELLLQQIGDRRFERVGRQITKEEIEFYKKEGLIGEELYKLAIQELEEVEKLREKEDEEKKEAMKSIIKGAMDDVTKK